MMAFRYDRGQHKNKPMTQKHTIFAFVLALFIIGVIALFASSSATQIVTQISDDTESVSNANDPAIQAGFVPHKALYEIKLAGKKSGSQIVSIGGQMFYEWTSNCDAWNSNHRFNLLYEYADTPPMKITSDFSTYETFDGKTFNFASQRKRNGELFEELRGLALNNDEEKRATFSLPEGLEYELKPNTLFPMRHTLDVLNTIKSGKKFFKATIFDGSDQDGPVEVNAFVGKKQDPAEMFKEAKNIDMSLVSNDAWTVQLAFFPLGSEEALADYEMTLVFHENGVISDMLVDYGDFTVSQRLTALDKVEDAACMNLEANSPE